MSEYEISGAMLIELHKGMPLHPGILNSGSYSLLLSSISRSSKNFEVGRAFAVHQLFTILKEASHTVVLLEYDPTLFTGAETMMPQIMGMLKEAGREPLVLLYAPSSDRSPTVLMQQADLIIEIAMTDESTSSRTPHHSGVLPYAQQTLEVS
jgi:hypothetical protein